MRNFNSYDDFKLAEQPSSSYCTDCQMTELKDVASLMAKHKFMAAKKLFDDLTIHLESIKIELMNARLAQEMIDGVKYLSDDIESFKEDCIEAFENVCLHDILQHSTQCYQCYCDDHADDRND